MGAPDIPAPGARSEAGRSTYSKTSTRRSRSARAGGGTATIDENLPASRFIYVEASYDKYCEALAWAKDQVRRYIVRKGARAALCTLHCAAVAGASRRQRAGALPTRRARLAAAAPHAAAALPDGVCFGGA
jgi:hypothetical protein